MSSIEPLIFFGTEDFSTAALKQLIADGWNISAVITKPDSPKGRGQHLSSPAVKQISEDAGLEVWQPAKVGDIAKKIKSTDCRWGVLSAYGQIIPARILDEFEAIVNIHPSLLPKYRGPSPIEAAILSEDKETGVSLMKLELAMDAGAIYAQQSVPLTDKVTRPELYAELAELGAKLLSDNLHNIIRGKLVPTEQDDRVATYTSMLTKEDGLVEWNKPAQQIEKEVRAFSGWPRSHAKLKHFDVIITETKIVNGPSKERLVQQCGQGWLEISKLIAPSGREVSGADFMRGYLNKT